jgi:3'-phosphoadenosine 5'-phosphosulfate (PAPS) 3'-phosphatase
MQIKVQYDDEMKGVAEISDTLHVSSQQQSEEAKQGRDQKVLEVAEGRKRAEADVRCLQKRPPSQQSDHGSSCDSDACNLQKLQADCWFPAFGGRKKINNASFDCLLTQAVSPGLRQHLAFLRSHHLAVDSDLQPN